MFDKIRELIAEECEKDSPFGKGEIELDESYFRAQQVRGKREGKVYTQIIKNCSMAEILPIIKQNVDKESTLYTNGFKTYDGLADFGYKKHYRIKHSDSDTK